MNGGRPYTVSVHPPFRVRQSFIFSEESSGRCKVFFFSVLTSLVFYTVLVSDFKQNINDIKYSLRMI